jgi:hypothetical protein
MGKKSSFKAEREFHKAAETAGEIGRFGVVNISEEYFLQRRFGVEYIPAAKLFHTNGVEDYHGKFTANGFVDFVSSKLPSFVRTFDRSWLEDSLPSVVLFTDQIRVPTVWSLLSLRYRDRLIRFGMCSEFSIHRELSIARLPTIIFYNGSNTIRYRGEMKEADLQDAVDNFLNGTLTMNDTSFDDEGFYRFSEFEDQCRGRDFCVLYTGDKLSDEYRRVRNMCRRHPMKFFYGDKDWPFKSFSPGKYFVWNPRRKGIIEVAEVEQLAGVIDRVIDGGAKWDRIGRGNEEI